MAVRMTSMEVVFARPFLLTGFRQVEPAGTYLVETEEECADDVASPVWKKNATVIHLTHDGATDYVRIDPEDLRKALSRDGAQEIVSTDKPPVPRRPRPGPRPRRRRY
jgi:hypothetical protein